MCRRSFLLLLLLGPLVLPRAFCDGDDRNSGRDLLKNPVGNVWSEPREIANGESFYIYCNSTNFEIQPGDLTLKLGSDDIIHDMVPVNNYTARYRENVLKDYKNKCYSCFLKDAKIGSHCITTTLLNVSDFKCFLLVFSMSMSCTFTEFELSAKYTLADSGQQPVNCWPAVWKYKCEIAFDYTKGTFNFSLYKELDHGKQVQHLQIRRNEIMEPKWESIGNLTCLPAPQLFKTKECQIQLVPQSAQMDRQNLTLIERAELSGRLFCFDTPHYPHQMFEVHLRCSLSNPPGTHWTEFIEYDYLIPPARPDRPPELLPNGFFHDFEKKRLFVYWRRLDELEFNGPNFTYSGLANIAKKAHLVNRNSAYFPNWDPTLPNTVFLWSENSEGQSEYTSTLSIPILTNSSAHQPQDLLYQDDTFTITWQPPRNRDWLIGYTVFWCPIFNKSLEFCDDREPIKFQKLNGTSAHKFQFNSSMIFFNKAVSANYIDNKCGGMQWIKVASHRNNEPVRKASHWSFSVLILICFAFVILLALAIFKKLQSI